MKHLYIVFWMMLVVVSRQFDGICNIVGRVPFNGNWVSSQLVNAYIASLKGEAEVNAPFVLTVDAGVYSPVCVGDSTQLNATSNGTNLTYYWSSLNPISNPNIANPIAYTTYINSYYYVQVTDGLGNTATDSVSIGIYATPPTSFFSLAGDQVVCEGELPDTLEVLSNSLMFYDWSPAEYLAYQPPYPSNHDREIAFISPLDTTTTFVVEIYWVPLCKVKDSVTVTVIPASTVSLEANPTPICVGDSITLTATPSVPTVSGFQFEEFDGVLWNDVSTSPSNIFTVVSQQTDTATFRVRTEDDGCMSDWSPEVQVPMNNLPTPMIIHD